MESLFNKVAVLQAFNFIKKDIPTHLKNFKNSFFTKHLQWLLLNVAQFPASLWTQMLVTIAEVGSV